MTRQNLREDAALVATVVHSEPLPQLWRPRPTRRTLGVSDDPWFGGWVESSGSDGRVRVAPRKKPPPLVHKVRHERIVAAEPITIRVILEESFT